MHKSYIIEVQGEFAGAAVSHSGAYRFIAVDPRVKILDHSLWPSLPRVQSVVRGLMALGHPAPRLSEPVR